MSKPLLRFASVSLDRGGRRLFTALDLVLDPGAGLLVTGPNGVGKSSLLRLAAGLLAPTDGRIDRGRVALADDRTALDAELPLARALAFWCDSVQAMEAMGLAALAEVPVRLLSSGQRRRAGLARVIASGADVWLLDEPANGLDRDSLARLDARIAAHRADGGAVVVASHVPLAGQWQTLELAP